MDSKLAVQIIAIGVCVWIGMSILYEIQAYLHRRKIRHECRTIKETNMLNINYTHTPAVVQKHIDQLNPGDVFMNAKHDPLNPKSSAGLYMAVRKGQDIYCVSFKGTALTYDQLKSSTMPHGNKVWIFDVEVNATARRR